jgi:hypothetical protein
MFRAFSTAIRLQVDRKSDVHGKGFCVLVKMLNVLFLFTRKTYLTELFKLSCLSEYFS